MVKGFFNDGPKLAQLNRTAGSFELRMQVKNESELGPAHRAVFQRMANDLSRDVFGGIPVEVNPCEGERKTRSIVGALMLAAVALASCRRSYVPGLVLAMTGAYPLAWASIGKGHWCRGCKRFDRCERSG
jgi:hypothetical protein